MLYAKRTIVFGGFLFLLFLIFSFRVSAQQSTTGRIPCAQRTLSCSSACGQTGFCTSDGCGGQTCCPSTPPCTRPTPNWCGPGDMTCPSGTVCSRSECPAGVNCTKILQYTCIPITNCGGRACLKGTVCYQPPMPKCPAGMGCIQSMPAPICVTPTPAADCTLRKQGDANCDKLVDRNDFDVFKSQLLAPIKALLSTTGILSSADFNNDGKVTLVDYEIWRNSFYK